MPSVTARARQYSGSFFATPLAAIMPPGFEERNAALTEVILKRRETHRSIVASNKCGWRSTRDFASWGGPYGEELLAKARSEVNQLAVDREGKSVKPDWTVESWVDVNDANRSNDCHCHPGSFWSGAYDVADGGCAGDPDLGGEFEMFDPRAPAPTMHAPTLKFAGEGGVSAGGGETIRPRPGLSFISPSFVLHSVRPYRSDGLRISIAMNFGLYPKAIPEGRD